MDLGDMTLLCMTF